MATGERSTFLILLLTWVNMGILVVNLALSLRQQEAVARAAARSLTEMPPVVTVRPLNRRRSGSGESGETSPRNAAGHSDSGQLVLDDEELDRVARAIQLEQRLRGKTVAVLQALDRLERRREMRRLDAGTRTLIVDLARQCARARALLEWELAQEQAPDLDTWDRRLEALDEDLRRDVSERLQGTLDRAELERVLRLTVSPRYLAGAAK